jgi:SAM-dependent methyltransferase
MRSFFAARHPLLATLAFVWGLLAGTSMLLTAGLMLWSSRVGKLREREVEDVAERVAVQTGDMRALPFADASFDVVLASLAIHNVADQAGRAKALQEIARVLKPGGQVALLDFQCTEEYVHSLRNLGCQDVGRSGFQWLMFPPVRLVTGRKPV